ncbi:unnamed protein product [Prorocentrum cordatum]|uniref:EamA domain-containing protein n=1 Tax=Prorocentrum cordatum TaxID=2364126 RepID=A0ABN9Y5V6_9DINO|nr:unnamed protein product [Polarella glacialis]
MFVPTSYELGIVMALCALCCWGSWSVTLVLSAGLMPFQLYYADFALSFLFTGFVVSYLGGQFGSGGEEYGFTESYTEEILGGSAVCHIAGAFAGVVWNTANVMLCKGIAMMGNAIGFPLCVGVAMVSGAVIGYVREREGDLRFLIPGLGFALCGVFMVGLLSYRKEGELEPALVDDVKRPALDDDSDETDSVPEPGLFRKFMVCSIGGLLLGLSNIWVSKATGPGCDLSPYANQTCFAVGVFVSSIVLVPLITCVPLEGGEGDDLCEVAGGYAEVGWRGHAMGLLGGLILCAGFFFFNLGIKPLGLTITYCIGQSAPLVGILWGTFFFREFAGTSVRHGASFRWSAASLRWASCCSRTPGAEARSPVISTLKLPGSVGVCPGRGLGWEGSLSRKTAPPPGYPHGPSYESKRPPPRRPPPRGALRRPSRG